jgi:hypothetical protein
MSLLPFFVYIRMIYVYLIIVLLFLLSTTIPSSAICCCSSSCYLLLLLLSPKDIADFEQVLFCFVRRLIISKRLPWSVQRYAAFCG